MATSIQPEIAYKIMHDGLAIHKSKDYAECVEASMRLKDQADDRTILPHKSLEDVLDNMRDLSNVVV